MGIIFKGILGISGKFAVYNNTMAPEWITPTGSLGSSMENITITPITLEASGTGVIIYSIASGTLPPGLSLSTNGVIAGTPNAVISDTTYSFAVSAAINGVSSVRWFSITVLNNATAPEWVTNSGVVGTFKNGDDVTIQLVATDPNNNIDGYTLDSGSLPGGINLNPYSGLVAGTVDETVTGDYTFTVTVFDTNGNTATRNFTISIISDSIQWITPSGSVGEYDIAAEIPATLEAISV